jgi:hypothetical protein
MSYTMLDWLRDNLIEDDDAASFAERMRDDRRAIVRMTDMDALVKFAEVHGVGDPNDNDNWGRGDANDDALGAIANWRRERRDWE